jgi:hypothetical protein
MKKAMTKPIRARVGDVFAIPIAGERVYGQVVDQAGPQYLVVLFRSTAGSVEDVTASGIELAGIVFDAKLRNGDWPIVANKWPVEVRPPWFVLGHEGLENVRLENFDGSGTRSVALTEAAQHGNRHISYPVALQRAAEAVRGYREWSPDLEFFRRFGRELDGAA